MFSVVRKKENKLFNFYGSRQKMVDSVHKIIILYLCGNFILPDNNIIFLAIVQGNDHILGIRRCRAAVILVQQELLLPILLNL